MLEYLIKVTANTFYIVVPGVLVFAAAYRTDPHGDKKYLSRGCYLGLLAALIYAVLKRNTGWAVREYYDLGALVFSEASCAVLLSALIFVRFFSKEEIRASRLKFLRGLFFCAGAGFAAYCAPDLLLYPFDFSVGMDNIWNTEFALKIIGYAGGAALMIFVGAQLFNVALNLSGLGLSAVFGTSLIVILMQEFLATVQILLGRNIIQQQRYKWLTRSVMWALAHENFFSYVMMALGVLSAVFLLVRALGTPRTGSNPAEVRRSKFIVRTRIRFCVSVVMGVTLSLLTVTVGATYASKKVELSPPVEIPPTGDEIIIPLDTVNDGALHRFVHKAANGSSVTDIRYIVIKKNDTAYGVGLDACDVCGPTGYYQRGSQVVCILCDVVMNISTIGLPGGCNPVPLKFGITGGNLVIKTSDLAAEARRFY
ncbi:MAG: DUF2318 domain-containing protein [Synergistaceae bacterium]|jgi:uncharacterized membrane protein|nr:DUF2318 domain-containing protein [Synergistaceae bacterium]